MADLGARHLEREVEHRAHVDDGQALVVGLREGLEVAHDLLDALAPHAGLRQGGARLGQGRRIGRELVEGLAHELQVGDDEGERVVDLVGDAGGQAPERLQLLGAPELGLDAVALAELALQAVVRLADGRRARRDDRLELLDLRARLAGQAPLGGERGRELADLDVIERLLQDQEALALGAEAGR